jgi:disulfide bond formation protein DsbB
MEIGPLFTKILALLTLGGNLALLGLLIFFVIRRSIFDATMEWLGARAIVIGLCISTAATLGSLIYSEVVGYPACILCWIQRIFMYPQMFLFGLALWRKERTILPYMFFLSLIGTAVALYQWIKDMVLLYSHTIIPCPAVTGLPSCDKIYVSEMGYITIPMIALNAFLLLLVITWAGIRRVRSVESFS